MNYYILGEGMTEVYVMEPIIRHALRIAKRGRKERGRNTEKLQFILTYPRYRLNRKDTIIVKEIGGKNNTRAIVGTLQPELPDGAHCVFFSDRDIDDTVDGIKQRFEQVIQDILETNNPISLMPFAHWDNVFYYTTPPNFPNGSLRFLLHIAQTPNMLTQYDFCLDGETTDNYILATALVERILVRFAKDASISAQTLREKVTNTMPNLIRQDSEEESISIKEALSIYMTSARFFRKKGAIQNPDVTFAGVVVERAIKYNPRMVERIFASSIAAIREVVR